MFPLAYFILFLWSIVSLLYALIKRHEVGIHAFVILTPNLWLTVNGYFLDPYSTIFILAGIL